MRPLYIGLLCMLTGLFSLMLLTLSGCRGTQTVVVSAPPILPHKVVGASDAMVIDMQNRLNKNGVKVITMGQDYLVSIPAAALFANQSPQLVWESYGLLQDVVCYLQQFRKISIHVAAYSSKCVSSQRDRALTLARARAVANYLWSQGIDSRFIFTHGIGSDKPIVGTLKGGDQSTNSRIEITFRDTVA